MKKITLILFVLVLLLGCNQSRTDTIKIGVILPLTGDAAIYGQAMKNGIDLAYDKSVIKDKIQLVFEDDMGQNSKASSVANFLLTKKIDVVIGGAQSKTADVIIPIFSNKEIPIVSPGASSVDFDSISDYFFRLWASDSYDGQIIADYILKNHKKEKIAVFYTNSKYGVGVKKIFEQFINNSGGKIVFSEGFSEGDKNFQTQIHKIKESEANVLFLPGYYSEVSVIIKQIRELGLNIGIYGTSSFHDEKLLEFLGQSANGIVFSYPDFDVNGTNEMTVNFSKNYFNKYGSKADIFAANTYDCFKVIEHTIMKGATNSIEIKLQLLKIKDFDGAGGVLSFDDMGNVIKPFAIYKVVNSNFIKL